MRSNLKAGMEINQENEMDWGNLIMSDDAELNFDQNNEAVGKIVAQYSNFIENLQANATENKLEAKTESTAGNTASTEKKTDQSSDQKSDQTAESKTSADVSVKDGEGSMWIVIIVVVVVGLAGFLWWQNNNGSIMGAGLSGGSYYDKYNEVFGI